MKNLLIANFKSHKISSEIKDWLAKVDKAAVLKKGISVALPFPYFYLAQDLQNLALAAQNVSPFPPGSYTGEVNIQQLKDFDIKTCIIGHSERRKCFRETNQRVLNKADLLLANDIQPIVCVNDKNYRTQLAVFPQKTRNSCFYAYEPQSSIGTGESADPESVEKMANFIQEETTPNQTVLYGGSVDHTNADSYLLLPSISGLLVGSESLEAISFINLLEKTQNEELA